MDIWTDKSEQIYHNFNFTEWEYDNVNKVVD